jgi:hypothetical protein
MQNLILFGYFDVLCVSHVRGHGHRGVRCLLPDPMLRLAEGGVDAVMGCQLHKEEGHFVSPQGCWAN